MTNVQQGFALAIMALSGWEANMFAVGVVLLSWILGVGTIKCRKSFPQHFFRSEAARMQQDRVSPEVRAESGGESIDGDSEDDGATSEVGKLLIRRNRPRQLPINYNGYED